MSIRQQKVAAQIRRLVSEVLMRQVHDPRIEGLVSVTKVEVTPDLHEARVYVSILNLQEKGTSKTVMHGLDSAARRIQDLVAEELPLRTAPRLSFHLDESLKKEAEMFKKIDAVARERAEKPVAAKE